MNSGYMNLMQGTDLENLLHDYYDLVRKIQQKEQSQNEYIRSLTLQMITTRSQKLEWWEFEGPAVLPTWRFKELQPIYREYLHNPSKIELMEFALNTNNLLLDYEVLEQVGRTFINMVENDTKYFDNKTTLMMDGIANSKNILGYADVTSQGQISRYAYDIITAIPFEEENSNRTVSNPLTSSFDYKAFEKTEDSLKLRYLGGSQ